MKIAYCILCHKNTVVLKELISQLKGSDIYIHVDKKTDIRSFQDLETKAVFIEDRVDVRWGHYGTIIAIINLLKNTWSKDYDYIFLLSGDCLPLKNQEEIKLFLRENKGNEYIGIMEPGVEEINRLKYKYGDYCFKKDKTTLYKIGFKFLNKLKLFKRNPLYKKLPLLYKGCMWFTITGELRAYILNYLEKNPWYLDAFKYSYCGDEVFFNTIIGNSPYKERIYKLGIEKNDNFMALRYIDWSGPELPKTLTEEDIKKIDKKDLLFGRKFSENTNIESYRNFIDIKNSDES